MKKLVVLVLTLGIVGVIANPISKQSIQSENNNSPQTESSDSQTKHEEVLNMPNKGDQEQKKDTLIDNPDLPNIFDTSNDVNGEVEIIIEENIVSTTDGLLSTGVNCDHDKKSTPIEIPDTFYIDTNKDIDGKLDILIEEDIVNPININPQLQDGLAGSSLFPEKFSNRPQNAGFNEDEPQMPGTIEDSPPSLRLPEIIGGSSHLPHFNENGLQVTQDFSGSLQLPGFVEDNPQLPGYIGSIPHMPELIEGGSVTGFDGLLQPENGEDDFPVDKDYFREDMQKTENEIMETAAGFIPTPLIFRRKQMPRRRFSTRRHFRRNPYRRHQLFYPYSYYAFYRPSSLRYY